jgi:hypothetical protein
MTRSVGGDGKSYDQGESTSAIAAIPMPTANHHPWWVQPRREPRMAKWAAMPLPSSASHIYVHQR